MVSQSVQKPILKPTNITIVGGGIHGARMAGKYKKFASAHVRAVVTPHKPNHEAFVEVPFFVSAKNWKKEFGNPTPYDVFDISVHQTVLLGVLKDFIAIGGKNFILPKPIALTSKELLHIEKLQKRHKLDVIVASQWHYSSLISEFTAFIKKNKKVISSVSINFSTPFDQARQKKYTAHTAFLPHAVQVLTDVKLLHKNSTSIIENSTDTKIRLHYDGPIALDVIADINASIKKEVAIVYGKKSPKPLCTVDFTGVKNAKGFVHYPSITMEGKKRDVREDVLEKMIEVHLAYFQKKSIKNVLTLNTYKPVAAEIANIITKSNRPIAVIGGGIFGCMAAIEIAEQGHAVVLFERDSELLKGASLVNQCRVHMGYHYPRDEKTAGDSNAAKKHFEKMFAPAIFTNLQNHYLIAKEGSLTTAKEYIAFCKKMKLPYLEAWPKGVSIVKDKISLSVKVPEPSFDANIVRRILLKKLASLPIISVVTSANVSDIARVAKNFDVTYNKQNSSNTIRSAAVVNATYSGANYINQMAGFPLENYQYELCEMPVVKTPWRSVGWSIIDGPFFGAMPFGFSKTYLFYDVVLSVLERSVGKLPNFNHNLNYYCTRTKEQKRFKEYQKKWAAFIPNLASTKYLYSIYVVRAVLPKQEKTDARPTLIKEMSPGFWQIFSGKITTSVPMAKELAKKVTAFLDRQ